ncbi:proline iminopeptidase-family hydrolase [Actinoplanes sp. NPDC048796]|uniref:proline iminopeptidase-family hydrolase n=1 Tax=Actinoplanes sp. NPDC048796 TaxID=3155640 RepID=UPI0033D92C6C
MTNADGNAINRRLLLKSGLGLAAAGMGVAATAAAAQPALAGGSGSRPLEPGERMIAVPGGKVWVNVVGTGRGVPLLTLHGGPGAGHDYLEPLASLGDDRQVIFYDHLGCGRSDKPNDPALWTLERSVAEVAAVRSALGLGKVHLFGHSFGGWLAIEYLLRRPRGVVSGVLASTSGSTAEFVAGTKRLRATLPRETQRTLDYYEARGDYTAPEYLAAVQVFYDNFLYRGKELPDALLRTIANLDGNQVYATMNGPNEFVVTGNLAPWNRTSRLRELKLPFLLTRGRFDEFEVRCLDGLENRLPHTERAEFANTAHFAWLEDERAYIATLRSYLRRQDKHC